MFTITAASTPRKTVCRISWSATIGQPLWSSRSTFGCDFARDTRATTAVEAAVSAATSKILQATRPPSLTDSSRGELATTNESAYPFFRFAQYDDITNLITRHRVLLRAVRRHRQPIEVVVEEPIPAGKVGVPVNSHQLVIISKMIGHALRLFAEVETMQN